MDFIKGFEKRSLSDVVVSYIKNKVLSGELKSGDKLMETEIANELEISRAPVREAMRELNMDGSVNYSPRKGNRMAEMDMEEVIEMFEIRISLENQILEKLVMYNMITDKDITHLSELTEKMLYGENVALKSESERIHYINSLDLEFHRYLWKIARSPRRAQLLEGLFFQLLIIMNHNVVTLGTFEEKAIEHKNIVDALRTGDLDKVVREFKTHIDAYITVVVKYLSSSISPKKIK